MEHVGTRNRTPWEILPRGDKYLFLELKTVSQHVTAYLVTIADVSAEVLYHEKLSCYKPKDLWESPFNIKSTRQYLYEHVVL